MSKENKRHNCQKADGIQRCPVIVADGSSLDVPSQKRKEQAEPILYIDRI